MFYLIEFEFSAFYILRSDITLGI